MSKRAVMSEMQPRRSVIAGKVARALIDGPSSYRSGTASPAREARLP